jgi:GWxTD domain-containing protein
MKSNLRQRKILFFTIILILIPIVFAQDQENSQALQQEEIEDYYERWLKQDVVYIISPDERAVFEKLATDEEKEQFIEQFWFRRDPDLSTSANEYKEEHYRRIAYANERFASGIAGWKTDRGRIYIIHGPPDEIEKHQPGESYVRPSHEGGGMTTTYAFRIWRYRYLEGIGDDVEIEFVDPSGTGEFRIALTPWEKDALLMIPNSGLTEAESLGLASRRDHPYFSYTGHHRYPLMHTRAKDDPFQRYETIVKVQRPKTIKYQDLKQIVEVNISYDSLPFQVREDFFQMSDNQVLVPITLSIRNKDLSYIFENGSQVARVAVFGIVTSMTNRVISEFENDLLVSFTPDQFENGLTGESVYQKVLSLDSKFRYKVDLVVKDLNSAKVGVIRRGVIPPKYSEDKLCTSSLILTDYIEQLEAVPDAEEMFVMGDLKVRPKLVKEFKQNNPFYVYVHIYNIALDQARLEPSVAATYRIFQDGKEVYSVKDEGGESTYFYSGQRLVLIRDFPIQELRDGRYQVEIEVKDKISNQTISLEETFEVKG